MHGCMILFEIMYVCAVCIYYVCIYMYCMYYPQKLCTSTYCFVSDSNLVFKSLISSVFAAIIAVSWGLPRECDRPTRLHYIHT